MDFSTVLTEAIGNSRNKGKPRTTSSFDLVEKVRADLLQCGQFDKWLVLRTTAPNRNFD